MPAKSPPTDGLSNDAIQQRAYYLWEADGRPEGRSEHYWQLALAEAQSVAAAARPTEARPTDRAARKPAAADKPKKAARKLEDKPAKKARTKPRASVSPKSR